MSSAITNEIPDGLKARHDDKGLYYLVDNVTMTALGFTVDCHPGEQLDDYHPVVFSMVREEEYDDDLTSEDGTYVMYPSDILSIEFRELSLKAATYNLKYYFPQIFSELRKYIKSGSASDKAVLDGLKKLKISSLPVENHGYDLMESLSLYIFSRIDFDDMGYEIAYNGPIGALTKSDDIVEVTPPDTRYGKLMPAQISGVKMDLSSDGSYRPTLIVAVPTPEAYGGYEAYLVPADSLMNLRNLRPRISQLGSAALQTFEDPDDIAAYFTGRGAFIAEDRDAKTTEQSPNITPEDTSYRSQFTQMTQGMKMELPDVVAYNEKYGHYRVSIADDVRRAIHYYDTLIEGVKKTQMDDAFLRNVCLQMLKSVETFTTLKLGDVIITNGATVAIDTLEDEQESLMLESHEFVTGTFCGFAVTEVPDVFMKLTAGAAGSLRRDLTLLINNVEYVDSDGTSYLDVFTAPEVALQLDRDGDEKIFKVIREADDE